MIPFLIDKEKVLCPANWDEVSIAATLRMKEKTNMSDIFQALTGFDKPILEAQVRNEIFPFITFIVDDVDFDKLPIPEFIKTPGSVSIYEPLKNLGHGTFAQKIAAQRIIHNAFKGKPDKVDVTGFMVDLLSVYMPTLIPSQVAELPFVKTYPVFNHYCNEILRLVARDKKYLEQKPDPELSLAGIKSLDKFGEQRIIDQLAGGDLIKYDDILKMEYDVIFKKLWYEAEQYALSKRLHKVREQKAKQK